MLTHHGRPPLEMQGGTTFVTDGIESALEQARAAAGVKDVSLAGGATAVQQYLAAGLVDELVVSVVPLILGRGARLFDNLADAKPKLEQIEAMSASASLFAASLASNLTGLGAALAAFGASFGAVNVSANVQGLALERRYGRPILSSFHAAFSSGGLPAPAWARSRQRSGSTLRGTWAALRWHAGEPSPRLLA